MRYTQAVEAMGKPEENHPKKWRVRIAPGRSRLKPLSAPTRLRRGMDAGSLVEVETTGSGRFEPVFQTFADRVTNEC